MKRYIVLPFLLFAFFAVNGQELAESEVPEPVVTFVKKKYPAAKVEWEQENANYEAEMEIDGMETELLLDRTGKLLQTSVKMKADQLPAAIRNYFSTQMPNKKLKDGEKITDATGNVTYLVEIADNDYFFDASGNFMHMQPEKEKSKDPGKN